MKLVNPTPERFEHLVSQLKWRLAEGSGEAIYEIGVEDDGNPSGLSEQELAASIETLEKMAKELSANASSISFSVINKSYSNKRRLSWESIRSISAPVYHGELLRDKNSSGRKCRQRKKYPSGSPYKGSTRQWKRFSKDECFQA